MMKVVVVMMVAVVKVKIDRFRRNLHTVDGVITGIVAAATVAAAAVGCFVTVAAVAAVVVDADDIAEISGGVSPSVATGRGSWRRQKSLLRGPRESRKMSGTQIGRGRQRTSYGSCSQSGCCCCCSYWSCCGIEDAARQGGRGGRSAPASCSRISSGVSSFRRRIRR